MFNLNGLDIFILMIFLHYVGDYILQTSFLANYKQKKNWSEYTKEGHYKYDFAAVLAVHAFSWAFVTFLPLYFYNHNSLFFACSLLVNTVIHMFVDHLKCNLFKINLIVDQLLHLAQIALTLVLAYALR